MVTRCFTADGCGNSCYYRYRAFSLTWPTPMYINWNKKSVCIRKEVNSHRTDLGLQHGRHLIVLGHQYGRRDVM